MMNGEQSPDEDALTEAGRPDGLSRNHDEGGIEPAYAVTGSPAPDVAARGGHADTPAGMDAAQRKKPKRARSFWRQLSALVVVGLVFALAIKAFAVQAFYIPSSSMEDTLKINDMILVNKLVYHFRAIARGDIIVFNGAGSWYPVPPTTASPNLFARIYDATLQPLLRSIPELFRTAPGHADLVKRVIGVPGDRVACCTAKGLITVNGVALHENSYLYPGDSPASAPSATGYLSFNITVPPGRLWVMGDHRGVSEDSRLRPAAPGGGTIPEDKVIGRAFVIVWPPSRWRFLPIPSTFARPGIDSSAGAAAATGAAAAAPYLPAEAGFALAIPLTLLLRQLRLRSIKSARHLASGQGPASNATQGHPLSC